MRSASFIAQHGRRLALAVAALPAPVLAQTQQAQHSASVPATSLPWSQNVNLPAFDPSLGILRVVRVDVAGAVWGTVGLENTGGSPTGLNYNVFAYVPVSLPNNMFFPTLNPAYEIYSLNLAAYDGVTDYAGPSGYSQVFGPEYGTGAPTYFVDLFQDPSLEPYVATSPGQTITIGLSSFDATSTSSLPSGVVEQHSIQSSVLVTVTYTYDPHPTTACHATFWLGCPCGNAGGPAAGCGNSAHASGATLGFSGLASISSDTLTLLAADMPNSTSLHFQGTGYDYGGVVFGDGIRCVAGTLQRLGVKGNVGGASQYPGPGDPPISVQGVVPGPGATRYYQTQYRDAASFCAPATFNVTNAVAVLWRP